MKRTAIIALMAVAGASQAQIRISEWMYSGGNGEFIEFTNIGASALDMTGWSYDDDSRLPGTVDLSAFGAVAAGESVILAEATATDFRTAWGLDNSVKVIGELTTNLSRNDEINIFDSSSSLVDRLTYGDQNIAGTIRTQNASGNTAPANWGTNNVSAWSLSFAGDGFGSWVSTAGDLGNPGASPVPEPATMVALAVGVAAFARRRLRK